MNYLVTGVSGFVGSALSSRLLEAGNTVVAPCRKPLSRPEEDQLHSFIIPDLNVNLNWDQYLKNVEAVVHLAARVHQMDAAAEDSLRAFREINVLATMRLAEQSAKQGVKKFVYISSIKVNGEETLLDKPFTVDDVPAPVDPYGISKYEAEEGLRRLSAKTGMEVVVIRPPLVYGPGVKANFLTMMRWLDKGIPLPLGAVHNRRSFVALDNLVDLIVTCLENPAAANEVFLVSDGEDMSTTELLSHIGRLLGKPARLIPVPAALINAGAMLFRKRSVSQRLLGSLQVDIRKNRKLLGWKPPVSVEDALKRTVEHYQGSCRR